MKLFDLIGEHFSWIYYLFEQSAGSINVLNNMIDEFTNNSKFTINAWFKILNETELEQFSSLLILFMNYLMILGLIPLLKMNAQERQQAKGVETF